ncbi:type IV pilus biogenesis protein PilM [Aquisalibacillus elongatus]|uniref:Type IV pilus assembly protein PilM n=1 Tax=Aquisalibacillus elongatus TaxID=485577 RepID=A0A3N5B051_9BACI|nr:pilus assembly protein PilM [Aquisalibacillus elongatus]RPF50559.1 type IV pilus assembly protein PilM [Aquisalibacillus elongatus]
MSKGIVNLEIKDYVIRFTESHPKNPSHVLRIGEHFIPSGIIDSGIIEKPDEFVKILRTCVKKWRLKRKSVRLTLPDALVIIRKQSIPSNVNREDINRYVQFQLGETIHLPFQKPLFETVWLNQNDVQQDISIISTCEKLVQPIIDQLEDQKMKVVAVDISPLNYYRLFYHRGLINEEDHTLFIQYTAKNVVFSAFEQHAPIFLQQIQLSSTDENVTFGATMTKNDFNRDEVFLEFDEIRTEIERVERFYQYSMNNGQQAFTKMAIVGDHPYLGEVVQKLSDRTDLEVVTIPNEDMSGPKGIEMEEKYYNVYGLAMKDGS